MNMKLILKPLIISSVIAVSFGAVSFLLLPSVVKIFLWPGMIIGAVVARVIPSQVIYALVPDGGGPAFVLIAVAASLFFWSAAIYGSYVAFKKLNQNTK